MITPSIPPKVRTLFKDLYEMDTVDSTTGLSPRKCLEFCLKDAEGQVEGATAGHAAGYAAGLAKNTRQKSPRLFDRLKRLVSFRTLEATLSPEQMFEELENQARAEAEAPVEDTHTLTQEQMLKMDPLTKKKFDAMDPTMQAGFFEAYLTAYREGYQKGLQAIEPKRKPMSQKTAEAIFEGQEAYTVGSEGAESLKAGLLDENLEVALDKETIDILARASGKGPETIQEAIGLYAQASEEVRESLWSEFMPEPEQENANPKTTQDSIPHAEPTNARKNRVSKPSRTAAIVAPKISNGQIQKPRTTDNLKTEEKAPTTERTQTETSPDSKKVELPSQQDNQKQPDLYKRSRLVVEVLEKHDFEQQNPKNMTEEETRPETINQSAPGEEEIPKKASQNTSGSSNVPQTKPMPKHVVFSDKVREIFDHSIVDNYQAKNKTMTSMAYLVSYKKTRTEQMKAIDSVREQLKTTSMSDQEKGIVLEAIMSAIQKGLKNEHRWTGTKSRLDAVLTEDINAIRQDFGNFRSQPWHAMFLIQQHIKDSSVKEACAKILGKQLENQESISRLPTTRGRR